MLEKEKNMTSTSSVPTQPAPLPPMTAVSVPAAAAPTGVVVGSIKEHNVDEKRVVGLSTGKAILTGIEDYNAANESEHPFESKDITDIEVYSIDPETKEHSDDSLGVMKGAEGKALLLVEYCITVKRDGQPVKIRVPQTWESELKIPTPGTDNEAAFTLEMQAMFMGISQKVRAVLIPNKNSATGPTSYTVDEKKMKKLCKLKNFDYLKDVVTSSTLTHFQNKAISQFDRVGSLADRRPVIVGIMVDSVAGKVFMQTSRADPAFRKKIKCKELEQRQQRLETVEAVAQSVTKASPENISEARQRLSEAIRTQKNYDQILQQEAEKAGDKLSEIEGFGLIRDSRGAIQVSDTTLDVDLQRAVNISKSLKESQRILDDLGKEKTKLLEENQTLHLTDVEDWKGNLERLKERKAVDLVRHPETDEVAFVPTKKPWHSENLDPSAAATEEAEVRARTKLHSVLQSIAHRKAVMEKLSDAFQRMKTDLQEKKERIHTAYKQLNASLDTIAALNPSALQGVRGITPGEERCLFPPSSQTKDKQKTLNEVLERTGFGTGEMEARVLAFEAMIDGICAGSKARVATTHTPPTTADAASTPSDPLDTDADPHS